jgi:hypothetical protein
LAILVPRFPAVLGFLGYEIDDDRVVVSTCGCRDTDAVVPHCLQIDKPRRQPHHQLVRSPSAEVEKHVEVPFHQPLRVAAEVAPLVVVDKCRPSDPGAAREATELAYLPIIKRAIDRLELVVLVLPHLARPVLCDLTWSP